MENETLREEKLKMIYAEYEDKMTALTAEQDAVLNDFLEKVRSLRQNELRRNLAV
jgi:hypothetical protein